VTANAQGQVERMLALVPYLREREGISVEEVAREFNVKPAQIVKDLKVLWFCGLPDAVMGDLIEIDMDAVEGEGVIRLSNADYLSRPLRLAPHEALALVVALRQLRAISGPEERDAVERTLGKLEAATGGAEAVAETVDIHVDPVDTEIRSAVDEALRDRRRMHIRYYVPARDETTERDVDPMRLVFSEGHGYLEAWCHRAQEGRLFRLDRITAATMLDVPAEPPAGARPKDLSNGLFTPDPDDPLAILDLAPDAAWVAEYYPTEWVESRADGRVRIGLRYSDEGWLQRLVLQLGGAGTLVEPAAVAARVRARAEAALAAYHQN
jgi:proteasome accessory factor C